MKDVDPTWFVIISELFVNLAALWLGGAFASIISPEQLLVVKIGSLTLNILLAIVSLYVAFMLRIRSRK